MKVEVVYAKPDVQVLLDVYIDEGDTVEQAVQQSGILERFPEIDLEGGKFGIFGHVVPKTKVLEVGDRIEIYRPITCDPKEVRRERAELAKKNKEATAKT